MCRLDDAFEARHCVLADRIGRIAENGFAFEYRVPAEEVEQGTCCKYRGIEASAFIRPKNVYIDRRPLSTLDLTHRIG